MPSQIEFESPVVKLNPTPGCGDLILADCSAVPKWLLRAGSDGPVDSKLQVPFGASRKDSTGILVLGSRPGEWILLGPRQVIVEKVDGLRRVDPPEFVTGVDWTHCQALFRVTGTEAPRVLEKVCSLDWSNRMTPDGAVVSASVARVNCDIARNDRQGQPGYLVFCDRSFGQYLFDVLVDAGAEFGMTVTPGTGLSLPTHKHQYSAAS